MVYIQGTSHYKPEVSWVVRNRNLVSINYDGEGDDQDYHDGRYGYAHDDDDQNSYADDDDGYERGLGNTRSGLGRPWPCVMRTSQEHR